MDDGALDDGFRAQMAETRAALTASLAAIDALLAGEPSAPGFRAMRDPETGQRLCDIDVTRGVVRFVTKWHGERRECVLPLPGVA